MAILKDNAGGYPLSSIHVHQHMNMYVLMDMQEVPDMSIPSLFPTLKNSPVPILRNTHYDSWVHLPDFWFGFLSHSFLFIRNSSHIKFLHTHEKPKVQKLFTLKTQYFNPWWKFVIPCISNDDPLCRTKVASTKLFHKRILTALDYTQGETQAQGSCECCCLPESMRSTTFRSL